MVPLVYCSFYQITAIKKRCRKVNSIVVLTGPKRFFRGTGDTFFESYPTAIACQDANSSPVAGTTSWATSPAWWVFVGFFRALPRDLMLQKWGDTNGNPVIISQFAVENCQFSSLICVWKTAMSHSYVKMCYRKLSKVYIPNWKPAIAAFVRFEVRPQQHGPPARHVDVQRCSSRWVWVKIGYPHCPFSPLRLPFLWCVNASFSCQTQISYCWNCTIPIISPWFY